MILKDMLDLVNKEKKKEEKARANRQCAAGIVIAAVTGMAIGVLFAPASGKETRENLKKKTVNTVGAVRDKALEAAEAVKDSVS